MRMAAIVLRLVTIREYATGREWEDNMPRYIATDWRVLVYPLLLMLIYLVYARVCHKHVARQAWYVAFYASAVSIVHAAIDFVPYYGLGVAPSRLVHTGNSILSVVLLLPLIFVLIRDFKRLNWTD